MNIVEKLAIEHSENCFRHSDTRELVCIEFNLEGLEAFAKAYASSLQSSEPEPCMCCGKGHLYCDECGTAIYSPSHKSVKAKIIQSAMNKQELLLGENELAQLMQYFCFTDIKEKKANERLNWWREMFPCVTGNTAKSYAEISELYLKAQAEKAELVRQCAEIVGRYDPDTDDALSAYVSRNAVYDEILSLLPKE